MARHGASHHLVSTVDDIAWLLNLRGADVGYNPVFLAHLLLERDARDAVRRRRQDRSRPSRAPSPATASQLAAYDADARARWRRCRPMPTLLVDPKRITLGLVASTSRARAIEAINPSTLAKSRKSDAEAAHVREAMIEDGVAMCEFYAWFEAELADPKRKEPITELTIDAKLTAARARRPGFVGPSFATIAALQRQRRDAALPRDARVARGRSKATACC